jgi:hypothetical protein
MSDRTEKLLSLMQINAIRRAQMMHAESEAAAATSVRQQADIGLRDAQRSVEESVTAWNAVANQGAILDPVLAMLWSAEILARQSQERAADEEQSAQCATEAECRTNWQKSLRLSENSEAAVRTARRRHAAYLENQQLAEMADMVARNGRGV